MPRPGRAALLLGLLALLGIPDARAEDASAPAHSPGPEMQPSPILPLQAERQAPAAQPAATGHSPSPQPRRRHARRPPAETATPPPQEARRPRLDPAPVPNRALEGPRIAALTDAPSFGPSIIHRSLPNPAAARDGSRTYEEERLFFPAAGARLTLPFSY
jgi:hypothetical protein